MPPTSIFPFIYCFVMTFSMLAMLASPVLVCVLFNSRVNPKAILGLDWLASLSEHWCQSDFLGDLAVQRSRWSKPFAMQRTPWGMFILRLVMAPRATLIKPLDMCLVKLETFALLFINPFTEFWCILLVLNENRSDWRMEVYFCQMQG